MHSHHFENKVTPNTSFTYLLFPVDPFFFFLLAQNIRAIVNLAGQSLDSWWWTEDQVVEVVVLWWE